MLEHILFYACCFWREFIFHIQNSLGKGFGNKMEKKRKGNSRPRPDGLLAEALLFSPQPTRPPDFPPLAHVTAQQQVRPRTDALPSPLASPTDSWAPPFLSLAPRARVAASCSSPPRRHRAGHGRGANPPGFFGISSP